MGWGYLSALCSRNGGQAATGQWWEQRSHSWNLGPLGETGETHNRSSMDTLLSTSASFQTHLCLVPLTCLTACGVLSSHTKDFFWLKNLLPWLSTTCYQRKQKQNLIFCCCCILLFFFSFFFLLLKKGFLVFTTPLYSNCPSWKPSRPF